MTPKTVFSFIASYLAILLTVLFTAALFGFVEDKLYRISFTVLEVGECGDDSCSIRVRHDANGTIWTGSSKGLVIEGAKVFMLCDQNYITSAVSCTKFYAGDAEALSYEPKKELYISVP